jgi:hypothetical protein
VKSIHVVIATIVIVIGTIGMVTVVERGAGQGQRKQGTEMSVTAQRPVGPRMDDQRTDVQQETGAMEKARKERERTEQPARLKSEDRDGE